MHPHTETDTYTTRITTTCQKANALSCVNSHEFSLAAVGNVYGKSYKVTHAKIGEESWG